MNDTIRKFGYPQSLVREFEHWLVLARPAQATLGSLVLAAKSEATSFDGLVPEAYAELQLVTAAIGDGLARAVQFDKLNYLMLMMVDPHVHFHVIPRYAGVRHWNGTEFADAGWPALPELGQSAALEGETLAALAAWLRGYF